MKGTKKMLKMNKKDCHATLAMTRGKQEGRSMVEMLGVLAIIGVLSVGGIYGYTVAMNKHKANEVAQYMSMLDVLAQSQNAGEGGIVTQDDLDAPANVTAACVDRTGTTTERQVVVSEGLCDHLKNIESKYNKAGSNWTCAESGTADCS